MQARVKAKVLVIALVAILLTLVVQGTLAFYTTTGKATSIVTSGNIQLLIHEKTGQGNLITQDGIYVVPGDVVGKEVSVESDCDHPFYLRVQIVYGIDEKALTAEDCFKLNIDETYWEYHDGWYYYKGIVQPGEKTPNVFSHVEIVGAKVDNNYIGKTLTLTVNAQAVQSENNPVENGKSHLALGWPNA